MALIRSTDLRVRRPGPSASVRDGRGSAAPFGPLFGPPGTGFRPREGGWFGPAACAIGAGSPRLPTDGGPSRLPTDVNRDLPSSGSGDDRRPERYVRGEADHRASPNTEGRESDLSPGQRASAGLRGPGRCRRAVVLFARSWGTFNSAQCRSSSLFWGTAGTRALCCQAGGPGACVTVRGHGPVTPRGPCRSPQDSPRISAWSGRLADGLILMSAELT